MAAARRCAEGMLESLPSRSGHFVLESGFHSNLWITLDSLFEDPAGIAPRVGALARKLRRHEPSVICGPLLGGAFLAQHLAIELGARFAYTQPTPAEEGAGLFGARYRLPGALHAGVRGERVAVVDDVVSAGSSVRASERALRAAGAEISVIGALAILGSGAIEHYARLGVPVETLERRDFELWKPESCPMCRAELPLVDPR